MIALARNLFDYRELIGTLAWKNITVRYKQAYLGIAWSVLKPLILMCIFIVLRSFIGINSGKVPYPVLTLAAISIWIFFQEAASEGVNSVVGNAALIRKIYFPREVFPLTAVSTKLVELGINFVILFAFMAWYGILPGLQALWVPLLVLYAVLLALTIAFAGAALNVHYRDVGAALPALLSVLMYLSPIIYPLELVKTKLLEEQIAGSWSHALYLLYTANPLAGLIDSFQNVMLRGLPPDVAVLAPGFAVVVVLLPLSYLFFKRAEAYFADVI